jgi:hypothetical protein
MKKLFILASLLVAIFMFMPNSASAQSKKTKTIEGKISGYECGDNCYLTITDSKGKKHDGLCTATACNAWNENAAMPKKYIGKRVKVTVGKGKQYDGSGTVMGTMDAFTKIVFLK